MSEGGGGDVGGGYGGGFVQQPAPSSTVPEDSKSGLPPFSSFGGSEMEAGGRMTNTDGEALQTSRLLDISSWDYYGEGLSGRLLDRGDGFPMLIPQPQYRPWESKDHEFPGSPLANKLPSFQSQFTAFPQEQNGETVLTTLTPAPPSPNSSSSGLPSFHTLSTVPPRGYPLVPAPVQAREIPSIQQQLLDERHIHLFQGAPHQQYHQLGAYQPQQQTTLLTVVKTEPLIVTQLQGGYDHHELKMEDANSPRGYLDSRKKERRKIRASSLESSNESDGVGSSSVESSGQVAAISSTAGFKSPLACHQNPNMQSEDDIHELSDKPVKKKRKRCGECIGCQRKDNCGDCAPCRNDKSHQICKMRRCEKLTEKKHLLYLNHDYPRGERGRGRGKGRGGGSYRKVHQAPRSPLPSPNLQLNGAVDSNMMSSIPDHSAAVRGDSKAEPQVTQPGLPPIAGSPMPLYSGPVQPGMDGNFATPIREHRFSGNSVWQPGSTDPNGAWTPQGQFIQQIPPPQIEELRGYPQYAVTGYPQPTPVAYQQNSFMQTNGTVYNSGPPQQPQPSPHSLHNGNSRATPTLNGNMEYVEQSPRPTEYINGSYPHSNQDQVMAPPTSTTPTSRCGSAQLENSDGKYTNPPTPTTPNNQGNAMPGYPLQMPPQSAQSSHNSSGYPGQENTTNCGNLGENKQDVWGSSNTQENGEQKNDGDQQQVHKQDIWPNSTEQSSHHQGTWVQRENQQWSNSTADIQNHQKMWTDEQQKQTNSSQNERWPNVNSATQTVQQNQVNTSNWPNSPRNNLESPQNQQQQKQELWNNASHQEQQHNASQQHIGMNHQSLMASNAQQNSGHNQQNNGLQLQNNGQQHQQVIHQPKSYPRQHEMWSNEPNVPPQTQNPPEPWPNDQPHDSSTQSKMWPTDKQNNQYSERIELNNRIKTMILNKQQGVKKSEGNATNYQDQKNLQSVSSGNFLVQGHHPQKSVSEGGGTRDTSPIYSNPGKTKLFSNRFVDSLGYPDLKHIKNNQPLSHNLYLSYDNNNYNLNSEYFSQNGFHKHPIASPVKPSNRMECTTESNLNVSSNISVKQAYWYQKSEPWGPQTEFITTYQGKPSFDRIPFGTDPRRNELVEELDMKDGILKKVPVNYAYHGSGGPADISSTNGAWCCRQGGTGKPSPEHLEEGFCQGYQTQDEMLEEELEIKKKMESIDMSKKPENMTNQQYYEYIERLRKNIKAPIPECDCNPTNECAPEPGIIYTQLGTASTLEELRVDAEKRTGFQGKAIRIEKIIYTGKEGKTTAGCPLAKWIIRRENADEKLLFVVKYRTGHKCPLSWVVVAIVVWEGVGRKDADDIYSLLTYKLSKFGVKTSRRCATNDPRTCACQGLSIRTCGESFSFGCSWSMYYNGCKFARSKVVRKFRLSNIAEEEEVEDKLQGLATNLAPLYKTIAPESYQNQVAFEEEASDCRLGLKPGRPFSGVTACVDFCAHSHRDSHNMSNGCTVVVTLTKHRELSKPKDEQLHVLPFYIMDETDEFGSKEGQLQKTKSGALECLAAFPCEVRVRAVPASTCRRQGKKRKVEEEQLINNQINQACQTPPNLSPHQLLQSSQITSTVTDSPVQTTPGWSYLRHQNSPNVPLSPTGLNTSKKEQICQDGNQYNNQLFCDRDIKSDPDSTTQNQQCSHWMNSESLQGQSTTQYIQQTPHYSNYSGYAPHINYGNYYSTTTSPFNGQNQALPGTRIPFTSDQKHFRSPSASPNGIFRRPRGRPPSRSSNPSTAQPVDSTFLKPRPPQERREGSSSPMRSPQDQRMNGSQSPTASDQYSPSTSPKIQYSPGYYQGHHYNYQNSQENQPFGDNFQYNSFPREQPPYSTNMVQRRLDFNSPKAPLHSPVGMYTLHQEYQHNRSQQLMQNFGPQSRSAPVSPVTDAESITRPRSTQSVDGCSSGEQKQTDFMSEVKQSNDKINFKMFSPSRQLILPNREESSEMHYYQPQNQFLPQIKQETNDFHWEPSSCNSNMFNPNNSVGLNQNLNNDLQVKSVPFKTYPDPNTIHPCRTISWDNFPNTKFSTYQKLPEDTSNDSPSASWPAMHIPSIKQEFQHQQDIGQNSGLSSMLEMERVGNAVFPVRNNYGPNPYLPSDEIDKEPIGQVSHYIRNEECFRDSQMGGVAIALSHGSVLFECAKHEIHATTAIQNPDRENPTRISLVFYQHRHLNRPNHGYSEWEEKMRLRKLGNGSRTTSTPPTPQNEANSPLVHASSPTYPTTTWTTLFSTHPCTVKDAAKELMVETRS
ncbi:DNA N6-methyl adenine demethylase isoform X2 [Cimex lectularius]|uniref:Methylcytosine dioxygenase TET n=1 Tax=Cimex lectularius TaxID=79782 RepID=A0A8I6RK70_CIMLE|nr:DNA N6-methyl adenine demethylase isoform X2 [Cimex lectularius]